MEPSSPSRWPMFMLGFITGAVACALLISISWAPAEWSSNGGIFCVLPLRHTYGEGTRQPTMMTSQIGGGGGGTVAAVPSSSPPQQPPSPPQPVVDESPAKTPQGQNANTGAPTTAAITVAPTLVTISVPDRCEYSKYPEVTRHDQVVAQPYPSIGQRIYRPHMEPDELAWFSEILGMPKYKHYFEYGMGGSTGLASTKKNLETITTVDTDMRFAATLRDYHLGNQVVGYWVNVGPVGEWGVPVPPDKTKNQCGSYWHRYALSYHKLRHQPTDLVFVDARWRPTCVFAVLLTGDRPDIVIHDFGPDDRTSYLTVLRVLDKVKCASTLCLFRPKANIDMNLLKTLYEAQKDDYNRLRRRRQRQRQRRRQ